MANAARGYEKIIEKKLFNGEVLSEFRLKNGFRILMIPRHQAKVLTYQVWFHVGSIDEKLDPKLQKTGLAHLFEHMMFRGTAKYPDGQFDELTSKLGGDKQNASTYFYRTNYYESVPSKNLEAMMELEADRMRNLKLTTELFEKEKGAVVGEFRRHMDNPGAVIFDTFLETAFEKAPYRYTVLGTEAEIKGFKLEEAQYFYNTFYAPNNATLIVIGDTDEKTLLPLVEKYYGSMIAQDIPSVAIPEEPAQKKERKKEINHKQATSEYLLMGYHTIPITHGDAVPLNVLSTHFSTGMEARLRKRLVDNGLAVRAQAWVSSQPNVFQIMVQMVEGKKANQAIKIIDEEIESVQKNGMPKESFTRALNQELLNLYSEIADNSSLGNFLGEFLMLSNNYMQGFEMIEGYKTLAHSEVQRVAKKYLQKNNRSIALLKPEGGETKKSVKLAK